MDAKGAVGSPDPATLTQPDTVCSPEGFLCTLKVVDLFQEGNRQPPSSPAPALPQGLTQNAIHGDFVGITSPVEAWLLKACQAKMFKEPFRECC